MTEIIVVENVEAMVTYTGGKTIIIHYIKNWNGVHNKRRGLNPRLSPIDYDLTKQVRKNLPTLPPVK